MAQRREKYGKAVGRLHSYTYSGLLACATCGRTISGSSSGHVGMYRCEWCRGGVSNTATADALEAILDETLLKAWTTPAFAAMVERRLAEALAGDTTRDSLTSWRAELADLESTPARFRERVDPAGERMAELRGLIADGERRLAAQPELAALASIPRVERDLREAWPRWSAEERRAKIAASGVRITVKPAARRGGSFDPSRVVVA